LQHITLSIVNVVVLRIRPTRSFPYSMLHKTCILLRVEQSLCTDSATVHAIALHRGHSDAHYQSASN